MIVNPARRERFDIETFGESDWWPLRPDELDGLCLHGLAVAYLTANPLGWAPPPGSWQGRWSGDSVNWPNDTSAPNAAGYDQGILTATADQPDRALYKMALDEFTDISMELVADLIYWDEVVLRQMIERFERGHEGITFVRTLHDLLFDGRFENARNDFQEEFQERSEEILAKLQERFKYYGSMGWWKVY